MKQQFQFKLTQNFIFCVKSLQQQYKFQSQNYLKLTTKDMKTKIQTDGKERNYYQKQQGLFLSKKYTTPGWSSIQDNNSSPPRANSQSSILNKIKSSKLINLQNATFKNITTNISNHSVTTNQTNYQFNQKTTNNANSNLYINNNVSNPKINQNITPRMMPKHPKTQNQSKIGYAASSTQISYQGSIIRNHSKTPVKRYEANTESWIRKVTPKKNSHSPAQITTLIAQKLKDTSANKIQNSSQNRFKQITIHEHLHLQGKKKQTKKMIQKIIQEEYSKKKFCFHPKINDRSQFLAKNKYEKLKEISKIVSQFEIQDEIIRKQINRNPKQCNKTKQFKEQDKENQQKYQYEILNKTFYYLTSNSRKITKLKFSQKVLQFPMPCIKQLQPLVQEVFKHKCKQMSWTEFISNFNFKCKSKQSFVLLMKKFFDKIQQNMSKSNLQKSYLNGEALQVSKFYQENI